MLLGTGGQLSLLVISGFGMMMVGIGFKLALVPFHMWTPDVYQGAPAPVSAYIATVSKGAVMAVLIRLFFNYQGIRQPLFIYCNFRDRNTFNVCGKHSCAKAEEYKEVIGVFINCKYGIPDNHLAYRQQQGNTGFNFLSDIIFFYNTGSISV